MVNYKFEYIWLDGHKPEPNLRGKTMVIPMEDFDGDVSKLPDWSYDGSSTGQAEWHSSDCVLKPVRAYEDPARIDGWLVMCEVYNADGTPHETNFRARIEDDSDDFWVGFEQEYVLMEDGRPLGFPEDGYPAPQGQYYCSVGHGNAFGRDIVEEHFDLCLAAGIETFWINGEVLCGQWEFQVFSKGSKKAGDDLWIARYLMMRLGEQYGVTMELHPKPVKGDWNGSGMHTNFSNGKMRDEGGEAYMTKICETFGKYHKEHIAVYGSDNEQRLTGAHETQSIDDFSYGVSDRGASIRIPISTVQHGWKGRLEDRRTASNAEPYKVLHRIYLTMKEVE